MNIVPQLDIFMRGKKPSYSPKKMIHVSVNILENIFISVFMGIPF